MILPLIFGLSDKDISNAEISLLQKNNIFGMILFARNIENKIQTKKLISNIKKYSRNKNINIFIDEEGGRVSRLDKIYPRLKSAGSLGDIFQKDPNLGEREIQKNYHLIAQRLKELGINFVCAPVADLLFKNADDIIGDRAFSDQVDIVVKAAAIASKTLLTNGITPIIKHIPGHGRAKQDSHKFLPRIDESLAVLEKSDFAVFKALNYLPYAMTAHIIYSKIDKSMPISLSQKGIKYLRSNIGFKGKIISDDINMKALEKYSYQEIISLIKKTDLDYILHCNGDIDEMNEIVSFYK
jgi:beta-N-acetylhexosaminidase